MSNRLMIFIDGSNVYHSLKEHFNRADVDFAKVVTCLTDNRQLVRTYYYNALVDQFKEPQRYQDQQRFLAALR